MNSEGRDSSVFKLGPQESTLHVIIGKKGQLIGAGD